MAIPEDKTRVGITMGNGLLARLDAYCERTGMTRSGYIAYAVAHQLDAENQTMDYMQGAISHMFQQLAKDEGLTLADFGESV